MSLPFANYHRTSQVGEGTYGSVVTVYNDEGEEFALKLFLPDDESDEDEDDDEQSSSDSHERSANPLDLGAMREISCLRLLRCYPHPNLIRLHDIQPNWTEDDEDEGAGTAGYLGMALPLYRTGSLADAIERKTFQAYPRRAKVKLAHDLLSAVAFLHDNGILHRDIKSDNCLLKLEERDGNSNENQNEFFTAVLIDFSLAKPINHTVYCGHPADQADADGEDEQVGHTGEIGTIVYCAPEVANQKPYGKPVDIWSVGVVLLELLLGQMIEASKPKEAEIAIQNCLEQLPQNQPFPELIRGLLQKDPSERLTARQALQHQLFTKFQMPVPDVQHMHVSTALPYDDNEEGGNDEEEEEKGSGKNNKQAENATPNQTNKGSTSNLLTSKRNLQQTRKRLDRRIEKRLAMIDRICRVLESSNPITRLAALEYSEQFEQLEESIDDLSESQSLLDCVVSATRFFELELPDLQDLEDQDKGLFANWTVDNYVDNEATLFMILDYCLYPRKPRFGY